jgi:1-phosphofructokinase
MILTVTFNPAIDHTYVLDADLEDSEIARTDSSQFDAGGKGINVSSYLKALDVDTTATGVLGGFTGDFIKSELDKQGLNHDFVEGGRTRVNTTVLAGDREYKINHDGPDTGETVVKEIISKIQDLQPENVVISGSLPPGLDYTAVEKIAEESDSRVTVDLSGQVLGQLEGEYFLVKPNEDELSNATGQKVNSVEEAYEAAHILIDRGFENVLASLGGKGALLVSQEKAWYVEGIDATVEDTTGAGDAILSGFLAGLKQGKDKNDALEEALAFATTVVETSGTQLPDMSDLDVYIGKAEAETL